MISPNMNTGNSKNILAGSGVFMLFTIAWLWAGPP
jgi:hypothetical protein